MDEFRGLDTLSVGKWVVDNKVESHLEKLKISLPLVVPDKTTNHFVSHLTKKSVF